MKQRLIRTEGVGVSVRFPSGAVVRSTALLGRASRPFNNMVSLESHRRGYFLPETGVTNGCLVHDEVSGEHLLAVAGYNEVIKGKLCSLVAHLILCNALMDVTAEGMDADEDGNLVSANIVKAAQLQVYARGKGWDITQHEHGLLEDGEYLIYATETAIGLLDKLTLTVRGTTLRLKVVGTDFVSFPNVVIVRAVVETR